MSISNIKSTSIKLSYTDVAAIAAKSEGYDAAVAIFVDTAKDGTSHKVRVVEWNDHPMDDSRSVLSRVEWTVPSTVQLSETIASKQAIASMIQANESRETVLEAITGLLRSHEAASLELQAIRKARLTAGKAPTVIMGTSSPAANNELATAMAMLANIASRLEKLEAKDTLPNELA